MNPTGVMTSEYVLKGTEGLPSLLLLEEQCFHALPSLKSGDGSQNSSANLTLALNITTGSWLGFVVRDEMLAPCEWSGSRPHHPRCPFCSEKN